MRGDGGPSVMGKWSFKVLFFCFRGTNWHKLAQISRFSNWSFVTCDLALDLELLETQAEAQGGAKASALATETVVFLHRFHAKVSQKLTEDPHIQGAETHTGREAFGLKKKLSVGR